MTNLQVKEINWTLSKAQYVWWKYKKHLSQTHWAVFVA